MGIADFAKRRANYSTEFLIEVLSDTQLEQIAKELGEAKGKGAKEADLKQLRKELVEEYCETRLRITRLSDVEFDRAREKAQAGAFALMQRDSGSDNSVTAWGAYTALLFREAIWPMLQRHTVEVQDFQNNQWLTVEDKDIPAALFQALTLTEIAFIVDRYAELMEQDREQAEGNESTSEPDSSSA